MTRPQQSAGWHALLALCVVGFVSCAKKREGYHEPVFPVRGKVFFKGEAAAGAQVMFYPLAPGVRPHGQVDQNGNFELSTFKKGDGAPVGDYVVTIEVRTGPPRVGMPPPKIALPETYASPKTSPLRATVRNQPNELEPFEITQ